MNIRAHLLCGALVLQFFLSAVLAQGTTTEGEAHVLSAFTTRADPRVFSADVALGPVLQGELGALTERETIYANLIERTVGQPLRVNALGPGEIVRYASLQGVTPGQQLIQLDAGELSLLVQYDPKQKNISFVEQISAPQLRAAPAPPKPAVEVAPPPPPVAEVPVPAPAPLLAAPPVVAQKPKPKPAATTAQKPPVVTPPPVTAPPVAAAAPAVAAAPRTPPKPRGDCVVKPVMSEQDLWNCSAPAKPAALSTLSAPAPAAAAAPAAAPAELQAASRPPPECVIKPVMSEEDLRICTAAGRGRRVVTSTPSEPVAVQAAAPASAPMLAKPPAPQCVIKPVMTEEELRICAAASRQSHPVPVETPVQPVAVQAAPVTTKPTPECVIKPVMSEEDLRICAAAPRQTHSVSEPAPRPVAVEKSQPPAPQPASLPAASRDCVIKPVMSEEDLRACGARR